MKVLITGGTGFVGSHTVGAVAAAGHWVKLFVRDPDRIGPALKPHGLSPGDCEHTVGDVNDTAAINRALDGCEAASTRVPPTPMPCRSGGLPLS